MSTEYRDWQADEIKDLKYKLLNYKSRYRIVREIVQNSSRTAESTLEALTELYELWDALDAEYGEGVEPKSSK